MQAVIGPRLTAFGDCEMLFSDKARIFGQGPWTPWGLGLGSRVLRVTGNHVMYR